VTEALGDLARTISSSWDSIGTWFSPRRDLSPQRGRAGLAGGARPPHRL